MSAPKEIAPGVTIQHLDTAEEQEAALEGLMLAMGFEIVVVGDDEMLLPIDARHPEYGKARRRIERARKALK